MSSTDARVGNEEYKKIHKDVEYTIPLINALKELPIHYRHHIKKGLGLGKIKDQKEEENKKYITNQVKLVRDQNFIKSQQLNLKRKENKKKRKEIKKGGGCRGWVSKSIQ